MNESLSFFSDGDLSFGDLPGLSFLFDIYGFFGSPHFDVALRREIRANSTVGSIGSSSTLGGSVDLDVVDGDIFEVFGVGVGLHVGEESEDNSD